MSKDFRISFECPHLVLEEVVPLDADRVSLYCRSPIATSDVVRVLANDEVYVPRGGYYSQAQVWGDASGPFSVPSCSTDLVVSVSGGTRSFTVPSGNRVDPSSIVRLLSSFDGLSAEVVRGHLVLTDLGTTGPSSFVSVSGGAASPLGFRVQRGAVARLVYPGWDVASSPSLVDGRYVTFKQPLAGDPVLKMSYVSVPGRCHRCAGTRWENDFRFNLQGELVLVEGFDLLNQAALKILLTRVRSNPFHPSYGSQIHSRIGAKAVGAVSSLIVSDVQSALSTMQQVQRKQAEFQPVTQEETLYSVSSVRVTPDAADPTMFRVDVVVFSASNKPVSLSVTYRSPGTGVL